MTNDFQPSARSRAIGRPLPARADLCRVIAAHLYPSLYPCKVSGCEHLVGKNQCVPDVINEAGMTLAMLTSLLSDPMWEFFLSSEDFGQCVNMELTPTEAAWATHGRPGFAATYAVKDLGFGIAHLFALANGLWKSDPSPSAIP